MKYTKEQKQALRKFYRDQARDMLRPKLLIAYIGGLICYSFGIYAGAMEKFVYDKWIHIQGQVTELEFYTITEKGSDEPEEVYDLTVRYSFNGQEKIVEEKAFTGKPKVQVGGPIPVKINPKNYDEIRITDGYEKFFVGTAFVLGTFLCLIGSAWFFKRKPS